MSEEDIRKASLLYHEKPIPGKIATKITKKADTPQELSLAYSPGVAAPVREIIKNPDNAYKYTGKGNLVAVISNGSAVLGLGDTGALASKPVMEGKALLFKRFADINAIDIEVDTSNPQYFIETVRRIAPSFGGINLEDIKAPECFIIEQALIRQCRIPIFHDDQHGTAIVTAAALLNGLEILGKDLKKVNLVILGAGAAGVASASLLINCGLPAANILMLDRSGVIHTDRDNLPDYKLAFARKTSRRTLSDAMEDADIFLGLSGKDLLSQEQVTRMAKNPIILACSNPDPEIRPELVYEAHPNAIVATGRSDYPNQVNNLLGFPFIFRAALDVQAEVINKEMKLAAVEALRRLAKEPVPQEVLDAYQQKTLSFGPEYIVPKPIDPRLKLFVSQFVANAAIKSGVARNTNVKYL